MGLHVFDTAVSVFNVLADKGEVNGYVCSGKDSVYSWVVAKDSLVGKGVPNLASGNIDALGVIKAKVRYTEKHLVE